jgi:hypothetical protein
MTLAIAALAFAAEPVAGAAVLALAGVDAALGCWRVGPAIRRAVVDACERRRTPRAPASEQ